MPRPFWKGHLSFGLVMMPVTLYSGAAIESKLDFIMTHIEGGEQYRADLDRIYQRGPRQYPRHKGHVKPA